MHVENIVSNFRYAEITGISDSLADSVIRLSKRIKVCKDYRNLIDKTSITLSEQDEIQGGIFNGNFKRNIGKLTKR